MTEYKERDPMALDAAGGYYFRHVSAMTGEKLHSKADIAAELGHRDMVIDVLLKQVKYLLPLVHSDDLPMEWYADKGGTIGDGLQAIKLAEDK